MLKRGIIIFSIAFGCLAVAGYWLLQSAWLPRFFLSRIIAERIAGAHLESFTCQERQVSLWGRFSCQGGVLSILREQERYRVTWDGFILTHHASFLPRIRKTEFLIKNLKIQSSFFAVNGVDFKGCFNLAEGKLADLKGRLTAPSVQWTAYQIENVVSSLEGDFQTIRFPDFQARAYDGRLKGQISLDYTPEAAYSIQLEFGGIDLIGLRKANAQVFSQVEGLFNGTVDLRGNLQGVKTFKGAFDAPRGGKIKAVWLTPVINYLPQSTQKKELAALIKANGTIPVETVSLTLGSVNEENLATAVRLKSARLNLDMNLTLDIRVEGGIQEILNDFGLFSK